MAMVIRVERVDEAVPGAPQPSSGSGASGSARQRPELRLSELVVGGATAALALLAWAALGLADLSHLSLPAVLVGWLVVLGVAGVLLWRFAPVRVRVDPAGCLVVLALAVLAAVMFLPGFAYGVTDKDPGGYT